MASRAINKKPMIVRVKKTSLTVKKHTARKKFRGNHKEILKYSLELLIKDLLPLAVVAYNTSPKQGAAYAVTNIISEIRGIIEQLESSVDADKIMVAISQEVALALRMSINRMAAHITLLKEGLPLKVKDSAIQRDMGLLLSDIMKEYEANMTEVITNIEIRIAKAVGEVIKGSKTKSRRKRK